MDRPVLGNISDQHNSSDHTLTLSLSLFQKDFAKNNNYLIIRKEKGAEMFWEIA